ncbi:MAG TPA: C39 family peptidase [Vicinamibacterales bacterium]|nr:C39 family peptidase [Vicinamibacterales bacterium]
MAPPAVPYHRQEGEDFCGPACLLMVIEALGQPSRTQPSLYDDAHDHGAEDPQAWWASPPDGMEWALENRAAMSKSTLEVVTFKTELPITRRLVWSLFQHSVPPIALVYGWDHWVVVVNYDISRNPTGPSDSGYEIRALEIHDPWRTLDDPDPPPPPPPRHVTLDEWQDTYLKPVPQGHWEGKQVAVGVFTE